MGLFDGLAGDLLDPFSNLGDSLGLLGGSSDTSFSGGLNFGLPVSFAPAYSPPPQIFTPQPMAQPTAAAAPAIASLVTAIPRWASRFPNLWQALQKLRANYGSRFTAEKLYSALKRFGPGTLTAIVGAQAVSELILYRTTRKRRQMNPANTRALRRSLRRLKSFDRLSHRVNAQLHRGVRRRASAKGGMVYENVQLKNR